MDAVLTVLGLLCTLSCVAPWAVLVIALGVRLTRAETAAMTAMLHDWERAHGYELIRYRRRYFGPWPCNGARFVFYVRLWDAHGQIRRGWIRCGGYWTGARKTRVEVCWERTSAPPAPAPPGPPPHRPEDDPLWDTTLDGGYG